MKEKAPLSHTVAKKHAPRFEYSPEEIQRMLADIDNVVSACKAEQQGVDAKDLIKTVRGGKVVWITRDEMNRILAKNRRISGAKYVQRSVRGENSLSSEINSRVHTCEVLINAIRKASPQHIPEMTKKLRNLQVVQNRSASLARNVQILELAIERKKSEDPILREIDRATADMLEALEKQDLAEADMNRMYREGQEEEYLAKRKRIEPYIKKAKECRLQFLLEKRKIYQFGFDLIGRGEEILSERLPEILVRDREGKTSQQLLSLAEDIRSLVRRGKPTFDALSDYSLEELERETAHFAELDKEFLTPLFNNMMQFLEGFQQAWRHFIEGVPDSSRRSCVDSEPPRVVERMAYQEKTDAPD